MSVQEEVMALKADVENLKSWQARQNGDIAEIRRMVFNVLVLSVSTLATALLTLLGVVLK